jgi:hypothetical protein
MANVKKWTKVNTFFKCSLLKGIKKVYTSEIIPEELWKKHERQLKRKHDASNI